MGKEGEQDGKTPRTRSWGNTKDPPRGLYRSSSSESRTWRERERGERQAVAPLFLLSLSPLSTGLQICATMIWTVPSGEEEDEDGRRAWAHTERWHTKGGERGRRLVELGYVEQGTQCGKEERAPAWGLPYPSSADGTVWMVVVVVVMAAPTFGQDWQSRGSPSRLTRWARAYAAQLHLPIAHTIPPAPFPPPLHPSPHPSTCAALVAGQREGGGERVKVERKEERKRRGIQEGELSMPHREKGGRAIHDLEPHTHTSAVSALKGQRSQGCAAHHLPWNIPFGS